MNKKFYSLFLFDEKEYQIGNNFEEFAYSFNNSYDFVFVYTYNNVSSFILKDFLKNNKDYEFKYNLQIYVGDDEFENRSLIFFSKKQLKFSKYLNPYIPHPLKKNGNFLSDWGGKKHLINKKGKKVSDVWTHLVGFKKNELSEINSGWYSNKPLIKFSEKKPEILLSEVARVFNTSLEINSFQYCESSLVIATSNKSKGMDSDVLLVKGDISDLEIPSNVDFVFLDPPYNLSKKYNAWEDNLTEQNYIKWCDAWIDKAVDALSENGSIFILNLPKWSHDHHLKMAQRGMYLNDWFVWDSTSLPNGSLVPAHYSLLHFTKNGMKKRINFSERFSLSEDLKQSKQIISSIHRIKHNSQRFKHPCNLPFQLIELFMSNYSTAGDVVLDFFLGTGTTGVVAQKIARKFIGIDISGEYINIARQNIQETALTGEYPTKKAVSVGNGSGKRKFSKNEFEKFIIKNQISDFDLSLKLFLENKALNTNDFYDVFKDEKTAKKSFSEAKRRIFN